MMGELFNDQDTNDSYSSCAGGISALRAAIAESRSFSSSRIITAPKSAPVRRAPPGIAGVGSPWPSAAFSFADERQAPGEELLRSHLGHATACQPALSQSSVASLEDSPCLQGPTTGAGVLRKSPPLSMPTRLPQPKPAGLIPTACLGGDVNPPKVIVPSAPVAPGVVPPRATSPERPGVLPCDAQAIEGLADVAGSPVAASEITLGGDKSAGTDAAILEVVVAPAHEDVFQKFFNKFGD